MADIQIGDVGWMVYTLDNEGLPVFTKREVVEIEGERHRGMVLFDENGKTYSVIPIVWKLYLYCSKRQAVEDYRKLLAEVVEDHPRDEDSRKSMEHCDRWLTENE